MNVLKMEEHNKTYPNTAMIAPGIYGRSDVIRQYAVPNMMGMRMNMGEANAAEKKRNWSVGFEWILRCEDIRILVITASEMMKRTAVELQKIAAKSSTIEAP